MDQMNIVYMPPKELWEITYQYGGIDKQGYDNYFKHKKVAHAYEIDKVVIFDEPMKYSDLGLGNRPPQTFKYLKL